MNEPLPAYTKSRKMVKKLSKWSFSCSEIELENGDFKNGQGEEISYRAYDTKSRLH